MCATSIFLPNRLQGLLLIDEKEKTGSTVDNRCNRGFDL